jgi:hypothetical protein
MTATPEHRLAAGLRRRGLDAPARLLLDAHRPLAPLLSDLGAALGPFLAACGATDVGRRIVDERVIERLVEELDAEEDGRAGG